jgi:ATP-dependent exoDNAse (exonuclease V) alpha subunit
MNVAGGLVNGSRGVVTDIYVDPKTRSVNTIFVRFLNGVVKGLTMEKFEMRNLNKSLIATREQFAITLGFATTIHKGEIQYCILLLVNIY